MIGAHLGIYAPDPTGSVLHAAGIVAIRMVKEALCQDIDHIRQGVVHSLESLYLGTRVGARKQARP